MLTAPHDQVLDLCAPILSGRPHVIGGAAALLLLADGLEGLIPDWPAPIVLHLERTPAGSQAALDIIGSLTGARLIRDVRDDTDARPNWNALAEADRVVIFGPNYERLVEFAFTSSTVLTATIEAAARTVVAGVPVRVMALEQLAAAYAEGSGPMARLWQEALSEARGRGSGVSADRDVA